MKYKTGFVTLVAKDHLQAEKVQEALLHLKKLAKLEKGYVHYTVWQSEENPLAYYVRESWEDQKTFDLHISQAYIQEFLSNTAEWLKGPINSIALKELK